RLQSGARYGPGCARRQSSVRAEHDDRHAAPDQLYSALYSGIYRLSVGIAYGQGAAVGAQERDHSRIAAVSNDRQTARRAGRRNMCESVAYGSGWLGWNKFDEPPLGAPAGPWVDLSYPAEPDMPCASIFDKPSFR